MVLRRDESVPAAVPLQGSGIPLPSTPASSEDIPKILHSAEGSKAKCERRDGFVADEAATRFGLAHSAESYRTMASAGEVSGLEFEAVEITENGSGGGGRLKHLLRERLNFL